MANYSGRGGRHGDAAKRRHGEGAGWRMDPRPVGRKTRLAKGWGELYRVYAPVLSRVVDAVCRLGVMQRRCVFVGSRPRRGQTTRRGSRPARTATMRKQRPSARRVFRPTDRIAPSPHRRVAVSPCRRVAPSPTRRVAHTLPLCFLPPFTLFEGSDKEGLIHLHRKLLPEPFCRGRLQFPRG